MSETHNADGVKSADGQSAVVVDDTTKPQTVKFETYDKAMSSYAKEKERRQELEKQLNDIKEKEMLSQGKYQELLAEREKELKELKDSLHNEKAQKIIAEAQAKMTEVATKFGAHSADDVIKNISLKDVTGVDNRIDTKLIEAKVDELKKTKQYLFKTSASRIADGNPQTSASAFTADVNKMDVNKLAELYRQKALLK